MRIHPLLFVACFGQPHFNKDSRLNFELGWNSCCPLEQPKSNCPDPSGGHWRDWGTINSTQIEKIVADTVAKTMPTMMASFFASAAFQIPRYSYQHLLRSLLNQL